MTTMTSMKNEHRNLTHKSVHIVTRTNNARNHALGNVLKNIFYTEQHTWQLHEWDRWGDGLGAITSALTSGADLIVAYGDHTLISDVANSIYLHDVPLAIVNDYNEQIANNLNPVIQLNTSELEKTLSAFAEERGETLWIDLGDMQDRRFLFHLYMSSAHPEHAATSTYQITVDDNSYSETGQACLISRRSQTQVSANGEGPSRPLFDVLILEDASAGSPAEILKRLDGKPNVSHHFAGSEIRIDASQEQNIFLDGNLDGTFDGNTMTGSSMYIKAIKKAIQIFLPDGSF